MIDKLMFVKDLLKIIAVDLWTTFIKKDVGSDILASVTFVWLQVAPFMDYAIFQLDELKPILERLCYATSWILGIIYLGYRIGKVKAEKAKEKQEEKTLIAKEKTELAEKRNVELRNLQIEADIIRANKKQDHELKLAKMEVEAFAIALTETKKGIDEIK